MKFRIVLDVSTANLPKQLAKVLTAKAPGIEFEADSREEAVKILNAVIAEHGGRWRLDETTSGTTVENTESTDDH